MMGHSNLPCKHENCRVQHHTLVVAKTQMLCAHKSTMHSLRHSFRANHRRRWVATAVVVQCLHKHTPRVLAHRTAPCLSKHSFNPPSSSNGSTF